MSLPAKPAWYTRAQVSLPAGSSFSTMAHDRPVSGGQLLPAPQSTLPPPPTYPPSAVCCSDTPSAWSPGAPWGLAQPPCSCHCGVPVALSLTSQSTPRPALDPVTASAIYPPSEVACTSSGVKLSGEPLTMAE